MTFNLERLWAVLNAKWRAVELDELKRMPVDMLEAVIGAVVWEQKDIDQIWQKERLPFEVF